MARRRKLILLLIGGSIEGPLCVYPGAQAPMVCCIIIKSYAKWDFHMNMLVFWEAGNPDLIITIWMVTIWKLFKWWLVSGMKVSQNSFRFESFSYRDWLEVWKLFRLKQEISDIQMVTHKWSENIFRWWHVSNQCTLEITIAYLLISFFVTIVNKSWLGIIWPKTNLKIQPIKWAYRCFLRLQIRFHIIHIKVYIEVYINPAYGNQGLFTSVKWV